MRPWWVARRAAITALFAASVAVDAAGAQAKRPDSARTVIIDSVRKTYTAPIAGDTSVGRAAPDLARTIDAEVRVAMFEMVAGGELPALSRLQRVSALVGQDSSAAPERAALRFLLAESYYRLGMLPAFRAEAEAAVGTGATRYAAVLRPQLVVEAYRTGDYARAASLARALPAPEANGLAGLVAGLAAYRSGDLAAARAGFQRVAAAGGDFAGYARYMDALAQLRADTAQPANAMAALEAVAGSATGDFADQARLTAAQVAYESERYDDAVRLTSAIGEGSPVAAPALLTRAWALYKLERIDEAERAFSDFASRYPRLPERDEARLMAAQAQLELGRAADAEQVFQHVADSSAADVVVLQGQTNAALSDLARALVADRAAELLVASDPMSAKALALRDSSGAAATLAAFTGSAPVAGTIDSGRPTLTAVHAGRRLDSLVAQRSPAVTRVLFAPASATRQPRELAERSQALAGADAAVAVARYRLGEQFDAQQREIALLARLAAMLAADSAAVSALVAQSQAVADSMARLDQLMAAAEARLRDMLGREVEATRSLAAENARTADSLRTALASAAAPEDRDAIAAEVATTAAYSRIAEMASSGLDNAIAHHPALVMRDSVRAHGARARAVLTDLRGSYSGASRQLADALAALRSGDAPATAAARRALADAEARRTAMEGEVIAAVTAELSARAGEMIATLQRGMEAAQFGTASAAFFRAIDGTRALGAAGEARRASPPATRPERRR